MSPTKSAPNHGLNDGAAQERNKYADLARLVQRFRLFDDSFMTKVFEDLECAQLLLHIILQHPNLSVTSVNSQHFIKNLQGRSCVLDILAVDQEGNHYDIEIQRWDKGAGPRRARYNSSVLDATMLMPKQDHDELRDTFIIFITEQDTFKDGRPIHHIDRVIRETGIPFDDGSHIIFVNGECKDDTPLGKLMQDFSYTKASDMHYKTLANRVHYFKETEEGLLTMCEIMEEANAVVRFEEKVISVRAVMKNLSVSVDEAMKILETPEPDREPIRNLLEQ